MILGKTHHLQICLRLGDRIEVHKFLSNFRSTVCLSHLVTEITTPHHNDFVHVECESIATYAAYVTPALNVGKDDVALGCVCLWRCNDVVFRISHPQCVSQSTSGSFLVYNIGERDRFTDKKANYEQL